MHPEYSSGRAGAMASRQDSSVTSPLLTKSHTHIHTHAVGRRGRLHTHQQGECGSSSASASSRAPGILTWCRKGRHNQLALSQGLKGSLKSTCNHFHFCATSNRAVQVCEVWVFWVSTSSIYPYSAYATLISDHLGVSFPGRFITAHQLTAAWGRWVNVSGHTSLPLGAGCFRQAASVQPLR